MQNKKKQARIAIKKANALVRRGRKSLTLQSSSFLNSITPDQFLPLKKNPRKRLAGRVIQFTISLAPFMDPGNLMATTFSCATFHRFSFLDLDVKTLLKLWIVGVYVLFGLVWFHMSYQRSWRPRSVFKFIG